MSSESGHDYVKDGKYNKICACVKCVRTCDEWFKKNKKEGCTSCRSKVKVIRVIECEQPVTTIYKFGETREYEGKWEPHHALPRPKDCKKEHKKDHKKEHKKDHKKDCKKDDFSEDY